MTSELRPASDVWSAACGAYEDAAAVLADLPMRDIVVAGDEAAAAVIEADREAVRAPLLAEIERLREALEDIKKAAFYYTLPKPALDIIHKRACAALAGENND